jgi:DNA-binding GntR family transcriptional regulator
VAELKLATDFGTRSTLLPNNRAAEVYEELRRAIVEGTIRPNERLIESELAERLDVSRTPVRESMLRLAGDGLIVSRRRGWVVREHSPKEIREVYEVRAALEGFAARLAALRATDDELARLRRLNAECLAHIDEWDRAELVAHNDEFHEFVIAVADNQLLSDLIHQNSNHYFMHRIAGFLSDDEVRKSIIGHQELVEALSERDEDKAERAAQAKVFESMRKSLAKLD